MRDNLPEMLRTAAKEWREKNKFVGVGETRYDVALEEAANAIEELQKRVPKTPHGRLIDADAIVLKDGPYEYGEWCEWALRQYQAAPTIIPTEEGE